MVAWKVIGIMGVASYGLAYACARIPHLAYSRHKLFAVPADILPEMPRGYSFAELDAAALAGHVIDASPAEQAERFAQGFVCLGVFSPQGQLVGVTWLVTRTHVEPTTGLCFTLPDRTAWDAGLWIPENRRLSRAFVAIWAAVRIWMGRNGVDRTVSTIADYNVSSLTSHRRMGARELGRIAIVRLGRMQITFGARPFLSLLGRARRPEVVIRPAHSAALGAPAPAPA